MLTENEVVASVTQFLEQHGYTVDKALTTSQQGIDIEATAASGKKCYVEAKGATSSKPGTKRFGLEFNSNQIKTHIGVALLKSFQTLELHPNAEVVIALPGNNGHRRVINSMYMPIKNSGIKVYFVDPDGEVSIYI